MLSNYAFLYLSPFPCCPPQFPLFLLKYIYLFKKSGIRNIEKLFNSQSEADEKAEFSQLTLGADFVAENTVIFQLVACFSTFLFSFSYDAISLKLREFEKAEQ